MCVCGCLYNELDANGTPTNGACTYENYSGRCVNIHCTGEGLTFDDEFGKCINSKCPTKSHYTTGECCANGVDSKTGACK